jgi:hypothetical protein
VRDSHSLAAQSGAIGECVEWLRVNRPSWVAVVEASVLAVAA